MLGELTLPQIEHVLRSQVIARIGCIADGRPYVVPITYVYDGDTIVGHSRDGMKVRHMRQNPFVCVEVDRIDDMANWESVVAWGRYEELSGEAAAAAIERLVAHLQPLVTSETSVPPHGRPTARDGEGASAVVVYRIRLEEKTGRFERR